MACAPHGTAAAPIPPVPAGSRSDDLARIQRVLEVKVVREHLTDLGLKDAEIAALLARLDDDELHELARRIDTVAAGGSAEFVCGPDCGTAIVGFAILIIGALVYVIYRFVDWLRHRPPSAESGCGNSLGLCRFGSASARLPDPDAGPR